MHLGYKGLVIGKLHWSVFLESLREEKKTNDMIHYQNISDTLRIPTVHHYICIYTLTLSKQFNQLQNLFKSTRGKGG